MHKHIEEAKAIVDGITDRHTEEAADDADEHTKEANRVPDDKNLDENIAAHKDKALHINKHNFEDSLRRDMEVTELHDGLPEFKVHESDVNRFMLFLPEHW